MYKEEDILIFNDEMKRQLLEQRARADAIYYCPHHPESVIPEYRKDCDCRKPKPGMIQKAVQDLNITLDGSFLVGDKLSDIEAGNSAGCISILVMTGHGRDEYNKDKESVQYYAEDLLSAVMNIILPKFT